MQFNFDEVIDRKGTNSIKYDFMKERGMPSDVLPLWVADMDFRTPPQVIDALVQSARHGIFGYSESKEDYFNSVYNWFKLRFDWELKRKWLVKAPGVVFAIAAAIRALTQNGDSILIQRPVYYPFFQLIESNKRKLVVNPLLYVNGKYEIDFNDFESKIITNKVKLFILCSPHNPVGRVWSYEELKKMGDICFRHNVFVIADEIHADFVYEGYKHTVFCTVKPEFEDITITCTAPSKTFNLAGLQIANIFISNCELRKRFREEIYACGYSQLNTMGLVACKAAYEHGGKWLDELMIYLAGNRDFVNNFLLNNLSDVKLVKPEGTYLLWLDFKEIGLSEAERKKLINEKAKLWLDEGTMFGEEGVGFERINIACPRVTLQIALTQLKDSLKI